jgi:hypothetical protein
MPSSQFQWAAFGKEAMLMANQRKWQFFNAKTGKWNKLPKGAYAKKKEAGTPVRILHPNGSHKTICNENKLPKGVEVKFSKIAADRAAAK